MWVREYVQRGVCPVGGSLSRPTSEIFREAAYLAYHFHWSRNEILGMTRSEIRQWLEEIEAINRRINYESVKRQEG